ncbi:MAG: papain-like cysteine protease family protein [Lachnospiraceae bacterium]|nr:C39 family peptidase [Robinsoniella sp.]MDY3766827.1 papain-like cysteine protease family protein [Lachnospiraceae bacterium]
MNKQTGRKGKYQTRQKKRSHSLSIFLTIAVCIGGVWFLVDKSISTIPEPAFLEFPENETDQTTLQESETEPVIETEETEAETEPENEDIAALIDMAKTNPKVQEVLDNRDLYPDDVLHMLAFNEETLDFVLDYPQKKGTPCEVTNIDSFEYGTIPNLYQWDQRWGYQSYGNSVIAVNGCGPTALAMVIAGLTGDTSITPARVATYSDDNNYYIQGQGTSWALMMNEGCNHFGIGSMELQLMENTIQSELLMGHPIICSMGPGDFTSDGHFIVLTDWTEEGIKINDPNSKKKSEQLWDYSQLEGQILNLWSYYVLEYSY